MNYAEAINWLESTRQLGWKLSLDRIAHLLLLLGNPHHKLRFIHVAGTNGKGSVTAMTASVLRAAGYRTGMYTTPELEDIRERMIVDGRKIDEDAFGGLVGVIKAKCDEMVSCGLEHPTQFELVTAAAILYFWEMRCDYVCLEVGMGGRLDASNVVTPDVSVITTISFDHMDWLGDTLAKIATEKAGIIKPGVPVVTGVTAAEPLEVISDRARQCGSPLTVVGPGRDVTWNETTLSWRKQAIDLRGHGFEYRDLAIPLLGKHQQLNAALAVAALHAAGVPGIGSDVVRAGLRNTVWPGRLEIIHEKPLIILDGAHNPEGASALASILGQIPRRKLICVYGILRSHTSITPIIVPFCDEVIVTRPDSERALEPQVVVEQIRNLQKPAMAEPDPRKAMDLAISRCQEDDAVLCCGSLYVVGPVRKYLRERFGL